MSLLSAAKLQVLCVGSKQVCEALAVLEALSTVYAG